MRYPAGIIAFGGIVGARRGRRRRLPGRHVGGRVGRGRAGDCRGERVARRAGPGAESEPRGKGVLVAESVDAWTCQCFLRKAHLNWDTARVDDPFFLDAASDLLYEVLILCIYIMYVNNAGVGSEGTIRATSLEHRLIVSNFLHKRKCCDWLLNRRGRSKEDACAHQIEPRQRVSAAQVNQQRQPSIGPRQCDLGVINNYSILTTVR